MSTSATTTAVPLPSRDAGSDNKPQPVWSLESNRSSSPPLSEKCDKIGRQGGICCKELKNEDDRMLIDPDVIRDM